MARTHSPRHRMEPRERRLLAAVIVLIAATVLATISQVSQAATGDGAGATPAAEVSAELAAAARIPNDQGPDAECTKPRSPARCHAPTGPPVVGDFVDIRSVAPNVRERRATAEGSAGTFTSLCGRNLNDHRNPDNFIVAPGVFNGAHHTHDYVGNLSADGNSTNESLEAAGTTCRRDDRSTYYWPVLRQRGTVGEDATADGGGNDGNIGRILRPASVRLEFRGNRFAKVEQMPRFLRLITGDAKAVTNGPTNAKAQWTCTGFTNRRTTKYPLCPRGSQVQRVLDFPSCWDGVNTDSANHRAHVIFPAGDGRCPEGTKPIAQLRMTLTYSVPRGRSFALDTFPEQNHNPLTDHADFANVMPANLITFATDCINRGRRC
ncbi:DUF1996 domain-containing protein [Catellatospora sp. NPDC049111]|uniref:DUF1996 domain-containing protein n=1 Tax=Catellatospora sp. NPDC049111 TaxID=3155271 RepID=UPI0033DA5F90